MTTDMSETTEPERGEYDRALLAAQQAVIAIGKSSENKQGGGYWYTSSEDLIGVCGQALNNAGLTCVRLRVAVGAWECVAMATKRGEQQMFHAPVQMVFRVAHAGSGHVEDHRFEFPAVVNSAGKPFDKAVAGALTASEGYFLRDLLMVSRGHDQYDIDRDEPQPQAVPPPRNPKGEHKHGPAAPADLAGFLGEQGFTVDQYVAYRAARGLEQLDTSNEWGIGGSIHKLRHGGRGPDLAKWVQAGQPEQWTPAEGVA